VQSFSFGNYIKGQFQMQILVKVITGLILSILNFSIALNAKTLEFEHLTVADGLSQSVVLCVLQDNQGFMWFGTEDGLNKHDGYQFTVYRHEADNPNSLSNNYIWSIYQDKTGILWIATGHGLNKFDPVSETFVRYQHDKKNPNSLSHNDVRDIFEDHTGVLWIGTLGGGVNQFDRETEQFVRYQHNEQDPYSLSYNEIYWDGTIYEDKTNTLWIATYGGGLNKFDRQAKTFVRYQHNLDAPDSLSNDTISAIYEDNNGTLWIGTDDGLNEFNPHTETFIHHLPERIINAVYQDNNGLLWIGTDSFGLYQFDPESNQILQHYQHKNSQTDSLSSNYVNVIYPDNAGTLWLATWGGGLSKITPFKKFKHYRHQANNPNSLSYNILWDIYEDSQGLIWIATEGGLNKFDPQTETFVSYQHDEDNPKSIISDDIYGMTEDSQGTLWVGTWDGLSEFDRQTETFKHYQHDENDSNSLSHDNINQIFRDSNGLLWIGTWGGGLNKFDPKTKTFVRYLHDDKNPNSLIHDQVNAIYEDSQNVLWVGTVGGLEQFDPKTESFKHYQHDGKNPNSLSGNHIYAIYEDSRGSFWIGTAGTGLNQFARTTATFTRYHTKNSGIPNDTVNDILEDNQGHLWLSTNKGLSKFNPRTNTFRNYTMEDGLQSNEFFHGAASKTQSGELLFGGNNGFNRFHPEQLKDNPFIPPVIITDFQIFNQSVGIGENSPLQQPIGLTKALTLSYQDSVFSFEFAALNYIIPNKNQYTYKMEGFDKDWTYVNSHRRFATYTNLNAGHYTFKVKASNNDEIWNEEGTAIDITITPPWWETTFFRISLFVLMIGLIVGGFRWRIRAIERQKHQLEIQVTQRTKELSEKTEELLQSHQELAQSYQQLETAKEKAEVANKAKSTFLASMSHELRTPLNAILGFAQIMQRSRTLPAEHRDNLNIINRSGNYLLSLINDVLDMSKIEAGKITLDEQNFDLSRLLDEIYDLFYLKAESKQLQLQVDRSDNLPRYIRTDGKKLRQVLINLISNALKFTQEGGVSLYAENEEARFLPPSIPPAGGEVPPPSGRGLGGGRNPDTEITILHFSVADTGPGVAQEEMDKLFEAFSQTETGRASQEGTGLGLPISRQFVQLMGGDIKVQSQVGKGTVFEITIRAQIVEAADSASEQPTQQVIALEPNQPRYRILIVDDKWENRQLLIQLLNPFGFELREASNGQEAIDIFDKWQPDLIWMDIRMPVMDGLQATQQIKAKPQGQQVAIIALTASILEEERENILAVGCDDFLHKPFKEGTIFDLMHQHIGVRYVYETVKGSEPALDKQAQQDILTPEALADLPNELLTQIQQAAIELDAELMQTLIAQVQAHNKALANALQQITNNFQYDHLLDLIEKTNGE
jgi:signal transduction histidine kinase/ligand-binding sensor domain-containing protein/CheY-like chemotaxis protein